MGVDEIAKGGVAAYNPAVFGPALPDCHNQRTPVFEFVQASSASGESSGVGADSVFVSYNRRVFSAVFRCVDIPEEVSIKIGERHIDIDKDYLMHIEPGSRGNSFHLSVYLWEAFLNNVPVEILTKSVEEFDIAAITLAENEIICREHSCEYCWVSGDELFSVRNTAFVWGTADCYAYPSVVGFRPSPCPRLCLCPSPCLCPCRRSLTSFSCRHRHDILYITHK